MVDVSPHRLIVMPFEGVCAVINLASVAMWRGEVLAKAQTLDKTTSTIGQGLQASLDHQRGGEIAMQLNNLYDYMLCCLLLANASNDLMILAEVDVLPVSPQNVWLAIGQAGQPGAAAVDSHLNVVS